MKLPRPVRVVTRVESGGGGQVLVVENRERRVADALIEDDAEAPGER